LSSSASYLGICSLKTSSVIDLTWSMQAVVIIWQKDGVVVLVASDNRIRDNAGHPEIEARLDQAMYFHDYKLHN